MKNIILFLLLSACSHSPTQTKKSLVLLQGFHLDDRSWDQIRAHIPTKDFTVTTPGRIGRDVPSPSIREIAKLNCEATPPHSTIVAHSFGGAVATAMVGICPEKITKIIFVSAIIPKNNQKLFDGLTSKVDQDNYGKAVLFDKKMINPRESHLFFRATDPAVDVSSQTLPRLYSESMDIISEKVIFNPSAFKKIPKVYIVTENDPPVGAETQRKFVKAAGIKSVYSIPTGHFPMVSSPKELTDIILKEVL